MQPPMQRAIMNRAQQARRSFAGFPQKVEGVQGSPLAQPEGSVQNHSPHSQPTPASHMSSPSTTATKSPNFIPTISPNMGPVSQTQQQQQQQQQLRPQPARPQYNPLPPQRTSLNTQFASGSGLPSASSVNSAGGNALAGNGNGPSAFYPSPFQSHMDQLGKLSRPLFRLLRHRALFVLD